MKTNAQKCKIDLHVHSPASADYAGARGPRGYAELASAYVDAGVSVIALTDHNTVKGYIEYQAHAANAKSAYGFIAARNDNPTYSKQLKEEVDCYGRLHVFPGVEISVYPNIHIILIFDPCVINEVTEFLRNDAELGDAVENGDPAKTSKHSVLVILEKAAIRFGDKFFCILPHVESSKGVWQELEGGARADILKDDKVLAVQFSNPETVNQMSAALNNPQYKRRSPLGFIQASDYHGSSGIQAASAHAIVQMQPPISFQALRDVLGKKEFIRNSHEFVEQHMADYVNGYKCISFNFTNKLEIPPDREADFLRGLCGIMNAPNTVLRMNLHNVASTAEKGGEIVTELIKKLIDKIDPPDSFEFEVAQFDQSNTRQRFIVKFKNKRLRLFDSICWIIDDGNARPAHAWELECIVSGNLYTRYGKASQNSLVSASERLLQASSSIPAVPIVARMDNYLERRRTGQFELKLVRPSYSKEICEDLGYPNGVADGDFYLIRHDLNLKGGRLNQEQVYYRFSVATYPLAGRKQEEPVVVGPNCLIVFPDGGVNVIEQARPLYAPYPVFVITIAESAGLGDQEKHDRLYGLSAWLKSSFVLWYIIAIYGTDDLFDVLISHRRLPLPKDAKALHGLSVFTKNILVEERTFLRECAKPKTTRDKTEDVEEANKHNRSVSKTMRLVDRDVLRYLQADSDEINEIYRALSKLNLYNFEIASDLEEFVKDTTGR